jgi:hypothetical protein
VRISNGHGGGNGRHRGRLRENELRADVATLVESFDKVQKLRSNTLKAAARTRAALYRAARERGVSGALLRMLAST